MNTFILAAIRATSHASRQLRWRSYAGLSGHRHSSGHRFGLTSRRSSTEVDTTWIIWRQNLVSHYRTLDKSELAALDVALSAGNVADLCEVLLGYFDEQ